MTQKIDIAYRAKATSEAINKRMQDITGPCVLQGFRLLKGTGDFQITLSRSGFSSNVAVAPSGVRIEETTDLTDVITIEPNAASNNRIDSIYLQYDYQVGESAVARYVVVKGTPGVMVPPPNPNSLTHLFLGSVVVRSGNLVLRTEDMASMPYGFSSITVSGDAQFNGEVNMADVVTFDGPVIFNNTTTGIGDGETPTQAFIDRLTFPITATAGMQTVTLPRPYMMGTESLFVFVDGEQVPPGEYEEVTNTSFRFFEGMNAGQKIWAYWYVGLTLYEERSHDHDDLYYRKWEVANRSVRFAQDVFNGSVGRIINHYLGHKNYIVLAVTPTEKSADIGIISVTKTNDSIIVYNTGTYRGGFDLTYILKNPLDYTPTNEDYGFFSVQPTSYNAGNGQYTVINFKRSDGTLHSKSTLSDLNAFNQYLKLTWEFYNSAGDAVLESKVYALEYNGDGIISNRTLIE